MSKRIRIGSPPFLSVRPLTFGLTEPGDPDIDLVMDEPAALADRLDRGLLDAALIPAIEYLRGVGRFRLDGPAQVVTGRTGALTLVTQRDFDRIERVAVREDSCTPLAVLRILLDQVHGIMPDFCVFKGDPKQWCESYDAILLTGDQGLHYRANPIGDAIAFDLGEMWEAAFSAPLVLSVWAFNDETLEAQLSRVLVGARDEGLKNLSLLADQVAGASGLDAPFLYQFYSIGWRYQMDDSAEAALRLLEKHALRYELIRAPRVKPILTS